MSSNKKICEIEIDDSSKWRDKLKKTIYINYNKAPRFNDVFPIIEQAINYPTESLSVLNSNAISIICGYLEINTLIESNCNIYDYIEDHIADEQYVIENYGNIEGKTIRILEVCKHEKINIYYNSIGGIKLYDKELFSEYNIQIKFLNTKDVEYKQYYKKYIPNLSIIDVLMFNSIEQIKGLLNLFELL
jgi:hypothetical protein